MIQANKLQTVVKRFLKHVHIEKFGCWSWTGGASGSGYGKFKIEGKQVSAHRFSYEHYRNPIPDGLFVCHHCDVKLCVNPLHLFIGTHRDNMRDMIKKGRAIYSRGERNGNSKLTLEQVNEIRNLREEKWKLKKIAEKFGVTETSISGICNHHVWTHD